MLSVIIPVYKVLHTLDRCVESVLAQSWPCMEVILVDDGSPDACPAMCDQWARRDARVRVVHKENGGLSDARNAGLDASTGELITFVDSDDCLQSDTYGRVLASMQPDADIIEFPVSRHHGSPSQQRLSFEPRVFLNGADYWIHGRAYTHAYAWNKIYRRHLFEGVRFPVGRVFEDVATLPQLLSRVRKVQQTDCGLYLYYDNPSGITATATGKQLNDLLMAHLDNWDPTADDAYYLHVLNIQIDVCRLTGEPPRLSNKKVWHWRGLSPRQLTKALLLNVLGVRGVCRIFSNNLRIKV